MEIPFLAPVSTATFFPAIGLSILTDANQLSKWIKTHQWDEPWYTVDGQNPAPPRMIIIPLSIGFLTISGGAGIRPSTVLLGLFEDAGSGSWLLIPNWILDGGWTNPFEEKYESKWNHVPPILRGEQKRSSISSENPPPRWWTKLIFAWGGWKKWEYIICAFSPEKPTKRQKSYRPGRSRYNSSPLKRRWLAGKSAIWK